MVHGAFQVGGRCSVPASCTFTSYVIRKWKEDLDNGSKYGTDFTVRLANARSRKLGG